MSEANANTIDLTPTWVAVLPILLAAIEDGTEEGRDIARTELKRMAELADQRNAMVKENSAAPKLLAAIRQAVSQCGKDLHPSTLAECEAAIAEATGG